jgi:hypothetical protein
LELVMARATVLGAFLEGWRRVFRAPTVTAALLAAVWFLSQPLTIALEGALDTRFGASFAPVSAETLAAERARELGRMIDRELGYFGAPATVSEWLRVDPLNPVIGGGAVASLAFWLFLSGGLLDRFARGRPTGTAAFFAASGVFFVRFLRLAVIIGAAYFILFRWVYPFFFETLFSLFTSDQATEQQALRVRAMLYVPFALGLIFIGVVSDFAKVRAVVEDRRGMLGAVAASFRFIRRRPFRVTGLYLLNLFVVVVILRLWVQAEPGVDTPRWFGFLLLLLYLVGRIWARLVFMASEVVFFQGELAHVDYTAAPLPMWPDSPAAEAMANLKAAGRRP